MSIHQSETVPNGDSEFKENNAGMSPNSAENTAQDDANSAADAGGTPAEGAGLSGSGNADVNSPEDAADPAVTTGETPNEPDSRGQIAELEARLADARDQLLRKAADFENFRKRMNQEKQNAIEFANQSLLLDIIPVIDDFERAIQSAQGSTELGELSAGKAMLDGIIMIEKRLTGQLEAKWGLKRFNSAGEPFDPNRHEAMMMEKSPGVEEAVVAEDFIKGYTLKERVIRAAKVKVVMPETTEAGQAPAEA